MNDPKICDHCGEYEHDCNCLAARTIKKLEQELAQARADKMRMDWIEDHRVQLNCTQGAPGNFHYQVGSWPSECSYRAAIDAQIKRRVDQAALKK